MVQTVSRRPLKAETYVRIENNPSRICDGQNVAL